VSKGPLRCALILCRFSAASGAKRPSSRSSRPTEARLKANACVLRRIVAAGDKRGTGLVRMSFSRRVPVAELLGHPVYEHSQARRQLPCMGVEDVDGRRRRRKAGEHFDQRAAGKLGVDAISRHLDQSEAHAGARNVGLWTGHHRKPRLLDPPPRQVSPLPIVDWARSLQASGCPC
jgi:hypothetical protein